MAHIIDSYQTAGYVIQCGQVLEEIGPSYDHDAIVQAARDYADEYRVRVYVHAYSANASPTDLLAESRVIHPGKGW